MIDSVLLSLQDQPIQRRNPFQQGLHQLPALGRSTGTRFIADPLALRASSVAHRLPTTATNKQQIGPGATTLPSDAIARIKANPNFPLSVKSAGGVLVRFRAIPIGIEATSS
jgi:hypothetical protein